MSRKLLSITFLLCFFINACASANVTVTSQVTVTFTPSPTATATLTPIPTVTFTPAPSLPSAIVADVEAALPGYTLQGTVSAGYVSKGDQLIDPEGRVVPEMKVIPHKFGVDGKNGWLVERTYMFKGKPFTIYMQKGDMQVMENGGLDMPAAKYIDGKIEPEYFIHTDYASQEKIVTDVKMISLQEAVKLLYDSTYVIYRRGEKASTKRCAPAEVLNINNNVISFHGLAIPVNYNLPKGGFAIGSSFTNGINRTTVQDNAQFHTKVPPYCWASIEDGTATFFGYIDENNVRVNYIIDSSKLNVESSSVDPRSIHPFVVLVSDPKGY